MVTIEDVYKDYGLNELSGEDWLNAVAVESEKLGADKQKAKEWAGHNYWLYCNVVGTPEKISKICAALLTPRIAYGRVYVFKFEKFVKVGYSKNPTKRIVVHEKNTLQKCVKSYESEDMDVKKCVEIETKTVTLLRKHVVRGFNHREWFHPSVFNDAVGIVKKLTT
jgi:hypothetical protein